MFSSIDAMYEGTVLVGLAYGATFCLVPTIISEMFGIASFGATFGVQGLAPALGSEGLSTLLAGQIDDKYASVSWVRVSSNCGLDVNTHCLGAECFRITLGVTASVCALAFLAAGWLWKMERGKGQS